MTRTAYESKRLSSKTLATISTARRIIQEYRLAGFDLTVRQLYYQFVARGLIENSQRSYSQLGVAVNSGRMNGHIDWLAIVDRTRHCEERGHWESPQEIMEECADAYFIDLWIGQDTVPEVWIEKEALVGVIENVCTRHDVPYFACRGYVSQSEMWRAAQRILNRWYDTKRETIIIHLGDHDPSGIDMTRDIRERLDRFIAGECFSCVPDVKRIALNMNQVDENNPPPNPAKLSDSRCRAYMDEYGDESWELDALQPAVIERLIEDEIVAVIDQDTMKGRINEMEKGRRKLRRLAKPKN